MAGFKVVPIKALEDGSLDLLDLKEKAEKHKDQLAAFMVRGRFCCHKHVSHCQGHLSLDFRGLRGRYFRSMRDRSC